MTSSDLRHTVVYRHEKEFAAWPYNHGLWAFPPAGQPAGRRSDILVGFSRGPCDYSHPDGVRHSTVDARDGEYVLARSTDGGFSWPAENLVSWGSRATLLAQLRATPQPARSRADWSSPDFCLTAGFGIPPEGELDLAYIQWSTNRGLDWHAPVVVPTFGFKWVQAKPDFIVRPDGVILLFVTVRLHGGQPTGHVATERVASPASRFVAVYASPDHGETWNYLSSIIATSPDTGFTNRYYASPVLLPNGTILAAMRCQVDARNAWPEIFASADGGLSWTFVSRVSDWGGPTHLSLLSHGRLLAVYGRRSRPYGIRARTSADEGRTWSPELVLREDGGSWDLGYPRAVELGDGTVFAAYYFNGANDTVDCQGGVRHIAGTFFTP
ncbi:MAG: sialidase family protein [bacterium]